jgi:2-polyprenyl-6-hydroxyphenyl methylase/3-demethylubiquinone-9 3-methyltransferase
MNTTVDVDEIKKFQNMATEWWDPKGKFKPLHMLNPTRLDYINYQMAYEFNLELKKPLPFKGLSVLDIGCGGGLLSEPIARLGANVTGADASEKNIKIARAHAEQSDVKIRYVHTTAEDLLTTGNTYDVILNMEVIEHVSDTTIYLDSCKKLLKNGGLMICSTINRSLKSYLMAIVGAEYILKWLPKGTHDWNKFITPNELYAMLEVAGLKPVDKKGFLFNPITWTWSISEKDLSVNYVTSSVNEQ